MTRDRGHRGDTGRDGGGAPRDVIAAGSTFVIERVGPADADLLLPIYRRCEDFLALGSVSRASLAMVEADLRYSREHGGVYGVIIAAGELIGVIDYVPAGHDGDPTRAALDLLMLAVSHRGRASAPKWWPSSSGRSPGTPP